MRRHLLVILLLSFCAAVTSLYGHLDPCRWAYGHLRIWDVQDLIDHHGYFASTEKSDNAKYVADLGLANSAVWGVAHFDISNLKWQNDKGILHKLLVNASENLFRKSLFQRMQTEPLVKKYLLEKFSDFKTCRFAFSEVPVAERDAFQNTVDNILAKSVADHSRFVKSYFAFEPEIMKRIREGGETNKWIERWHSGGWGTKELDEMTPQDVADLASFRSRLARSDINSGSRHLPLRSDNHGAVGKLSDFKSSYRKAMAKLQIQPKGEIPFIEQSPEGPMLSVELVELIKKNSLDSLGIAIKNKFKVEIQDPTLLQDLIDASKASDVFSPTITEVSRIIPMPRGYTVSIDIKGVGAKNSQLLMRNIALSEDHPGDDLRTILSAIRSARRSEIEATRWVEEIKGHVVQASEMSGLVHDPSQVQFTGDDGFVNSKRPFQQKTVDVRQFFLQWLISNRPSVVKSNQFRMVMVGPEFKDTKTKIPEEEKFYVINDFENMLKDMAKEFDPGHLSVSVSVDTDKTGGGTFRAYITGEKIKYSEIKLIEELLRANPPEGYTLEAGPNVIEYGIHK